VDYDHAMTSACLVKAPAWRNRTLSLLLIVDGLSISSHLRLPFLPCNHLVQLSKRIVTGFFFTRMLGLA
jgi:hypothetical protein